MSKLLKPFKIIREHWKKSLFFTCVGAYGLHWLNETSKQEHIRLNYCEKAAKYGDRLVASAFEKPENILVLINRTSASNKAKTVFEKNCAPILHLAGLDMETKDWEPSYDEESYEFLDKLLKDPVKTYSAVLVVGGNRSSNAFLKYAMTQSTQPPPAAFVPVGKSSLVMTRFMPCASSTAYVQRLCETAYRVVEGEPKEVDVLRIETKEKTDDKPAVQCYAVSSFSFDKVTDLAFRSFRYWYLPGATKRIFLGLVGLFMGDYNDRIFGQIEASYEKKAPPKVEQPEPPVPVRKGWFSWGAEPAKPQETAEEPPPEPKETVRLGEFDADYVSMIANNGSDKQGFFDVEVSTKQEGAFVQYMNAVTKQRPSVEESFQATDLELTLKLVPCRAAFHVDGVPHVDFDPVIRVSILLRAFKMFY